jgi:peptide/nickel transport system substrate-binding protein
MRKQYIYLLLLLGITLHSSTIYKKITVQVGRLNPIISIDTTSSTVSSNIFDGLIKYDKNANIIPSLAKKFYFKNQTTLIFELRDDVLWHDGKRFSAKDVVFTFDLMTSKKIVSPYAGDFKYVKSVKAINDYMVEVRYTQRYYKALEIWMTSILPWHILSKESDVMNSSFNKYPIGTGAYRLREIRKSKDILLDANSDYFMGKPKIDTIHFRYVPDELTSFLMLKKKELDEDSITPIRLKREIDDEFIDSFNIFEKISHSYTYIGLNLKNKKFKNPKIREAINIAIDKQEIIDFLFFGHGIVCDGPFLPITKAYNKNVKHKFNPEKSKQILQKLGYSKQNPFSFEIVTNSNNDTRKYAAIIIQKQLAKVGIVMSIRTMEWQAFLNTVVRPKKFEAVLLGWSMSFKPDAYSIWHSDSDKKGGYNFVGYKNVEVDRLIKKAEKTLDRDEFFRLYNKIFTIIVKDAPYIFLYIPNSITAVNKSIKNVSQSILGIEHNFIEWKKE